MSVEAVSLAWVRARPEITTVVLGVRTPTQLEQDMRAFEIRLAPGVIARLNSVTQPLLEKLGPSPDYYESFSKSRIY
jgi:aryl-alcohol dehydrogenase-like predicted oxidoreductase